MSNDTIIAETAVMPQLTDQQHSFLNYFNEVVEGNPELKDSCKLLQAPDGRLIFITGVTHWNVQEEHGIEPDAYYHTVQSLHTRFLEDIGDAGEILFEGIHGQTVYPDHISSSHNALQYAIAMLVDYSRRSRSNSQTKMLDLPLQSKFPSHFRNIDISFEEFVAFTEKQLKAYEEIWRDFNLEEIYVSKQYQHDHPSYKVTLTDVYAHYIRNTLDKGAIPAEQIFTPEAIDMICYIRDRVVLESRNSRVLFELIRSPKNCSVVYGQSHLHDLLEGLKSIGCVDLLELE